jgi:hypothetical protein
MRLWLVKSVVIAGVVGLVCAVGVALGIARFGDLSSFKGQYRTARETWRTPGYMADVLPPPQAGREMPGRTMGYRIVGTDHPVPTETGLDAGWFTIWSSEYGWPWYSMRWDEMDFRPMHDDRAKERITAIESAFDTRARWRRGYPTSVVRNGRALRLPMDPIWGGLVASAGVYAGSAWVVMLTPAVVRRVWRWWRGRCVGCGYDARGLARCPECGRAARPKVA